MGSHLLEKTNKGTFSISVKNSELPCTTAGGASNRDYLVNGSTWNCMIEPEINFKAPVQMSPLL